MAINILILEKEEREEKKWWVGGWVGGKGRRRGNKGNEIRYMEQNE